jgi:hypothetical protein
VLAILLGMSAVVASIPALVVAYWFFSLRWQVLSYRRRYDRDIRVKKDERESARQEREWRRLQARLQRS